MTIVALLLPFKFVTCYNYVMLKLTTVGFAGYITAHRQLVLYNQIVITTHRNLETLPNTSRKQATGRPTVPVPCVQGTSMDLVTSEKKTRTRFFCCPLRRPSYLVILLDLHQFEHLDSN